MRRRWAGYAAPAALAAVGLLMAHHPMLLSGLRRVQSDPGDSRLIHYFLEHDYRWFRGDPNHAGLWDPPFFYPYRNALALSDTLFGAAPLYGAIRAAGFAPDTSFQLWMMAVSLLNDAVMLHLLRKRLGLSWLASSAGAFLFAFGAPRVNLISHQQHMPQFLGLVTVDALFGVFPGRGVPAWKRAGLWSLAALGLAAQLSTGFYLGWFLVLALGSAAALALVLPTTRRTFLAVVGRDALFIAGAAALGACLMRPWLAHHLEAARGLGPRFAQYVRQYLPSPATWLYQGPQSWFGGWTSRLTYFPTPHAEAEQRLGVGPVTTLAVAAGLWLGRDRASVRLLSAVAVVIVLVITPIQPGPLFLAAHAGIVAAIAFAFDGRRERPGAFASVLVLLILDLHLARRPREPVVGAAALATAAAAWAFLARGDDRRTGRVAGILGLGLAFSLFALPVLGIGLVFAGLVALAGAVAGWRSRLWVEAALVGGTLLFSTAITYADRPRVGLTLALGAVALAVVAGLGERVRPPVGWLPVVALAGLLVSALFADDGVAWFFFANHVPGASALMFVARGGLTLLTLYAIGLGLFFERLRGRARSWPALAVGVVCLAEQGVTTDSFDKAENRREIAALARRIDDRPEAFFYSPHASAWASPKTNLDAMWAGLERGKPTVNGYSGSTPVGWRGLENPNADTPCDLDCLGLALDAWRKNAGRSVGRLQWVGGPDEPWTAGD